jgi:hypothetical protein
MNRLGKIWEIWANVKNKTIWIILMVIAISIIAVGSFILINSQEIINFVLPFGFSVEEWGSSVTVDNSGNIFVYGNFSGPTDFNPGPGVFNVTPNRMYNAFLCKFDSEGRFQWVRTIDGDEYISKMITDNTGNVYIASLYSGSQDYTFQSQFEIPGIFLCKVDSDGNILWKQTLESNEDFQSSLNLEINDDNNIVVYYNSGGGDTYVRSYNTNGELIEESKFNINLSSPFIFDDARNLYVVGAYYYNEQSPYDLYIGDDIREQLSIPNNTGNNFIDLLKLDSELNYIWADAWGCSGDEDSNGICLDVVGNVFVTGSFRGSVDFDPGAGVRRLRSSGWSDAFVAKYDENDNFQWAKSWGHWENDTGRGICTDNDGNIFITGTFSGRVDFNPGWWIDIHKSIGADDIFLCKYDSDGRFLWALTWGGENAPD